MGTRRCVRPRRSCDFFSTQPVRVGIASGWRMAGWEGRRQPNGILRSSDAFVIFFIFAPLPHKNFNLIPEILFISSSASCVRFVWCSHSYSYISVDTIHFNAKCLPLHMWYSFLFLRFVVCLTEKDGIFTALTKTVAHPFPARFHFYPESAVTQTIIVATQSRPSISKLSISRQTNFERQLHLLKPSLSWVYFCVIRIHGWIYDSWMPRKQFSLMWWEFIEPRHIQETSSERNLSVTSTRVRMCGLVWHRSTAACTKERSVSDDVKLY